MRRFHQVVGERLIDEMKQKEIERGASGFEFIKKPFVLKKVSDNLWYSLWKVTVGSLHFLLESD